MGRLLICGEVNGIGRCRAVLQREGSPIGTGRLYSGDASFWVL